MYRSLFFVLFLFTSLQASIEWDDIPSENETISFRKLNDGIGKRNIKKWKQSKYVDDATWKRVSPYLLSPKSYLRTALDKIFTKTRASTSFETMEKAGFECKPLRVCSHILVATHRRIKGYWVKVYLDNVPEVNEVDLLISRIEGANATREAIKKFGYKKIFKVPKKYLYPLPESPEADPNLQRKNFILVVEDVRKRNSNVHLWRGGLVTRDRLQALYNIVTEVGLSDSVIISNIPFCQDNRNAFLDTEHHHRWPIPYYKLFQYLSPHRATTWQEIINQGQ